MRCLNEIRKGIATFRNRHHEIARPLRNIRWARHRPNRYDHLGRRVQKITPEATHTYFYDGWILVKEVVERSGDTRRCGVSPRHCGGAGSPTSLGVADVG